MVRLSVAAILTYSLSVYALGDPAGTKNVGNGNGGQFIGGACLSSRDCASTCCAFISGGGVCSGLGAQFQAGKSGCGFGDGGAPPSQPSGGDSNTGNAAAPAAPATPAIPAGFDASVGDAAGAKNVGTANGQQFITGACLSDADCASGCCAGLKGGAVCSAAGAQFQNGKQGCHFTVGGSSAAAPANSAAPPPAAAAPSAPANIPAGFDASVGDAAGAKNVGTASGQQFITGACLSDADCASGCCAGLKGGAVCSAAGAQFQNGKQGCGFTGASKRSVAGSRIARRFRA